MMKPTPFLLAVILLSMGQWATADLIDPMPGKSIKGARGFDVEADLRNDQAAFAVRVTVDRQDRTYEQDDLMHVTVKSQRDGHLYLFYKQADGSTKCLFPNLYESDNSIRRDRGITIPTAKQGFRLRCNEPFGDELLVAVVTERPIAVESLGVKSLTKSVMTGVDLERFVREIRKGMEVEGTTPAGKPNQWAEHSVLIKTVARGGRGRALPQRKRLGLFIGISQYKDSRVRDLQICHKDAVVMALAMKEHGKLDGIGILTNEKATRKNIETAMKELKQKSNPGDEIFIYWSGHGASCADTGGDEADGRDEFLIPHDGDVTDVEGSMVLDDALGRWIQELDGRKVAVILDACHSGGQATGKGLDGTKGFGDSGGGIIGDADDLPSGSAEDLLKALDHGRPSSSIRFGNAVTPMDFLDSELGRIKDIGQEYATMLFSSASDEISAERRDGNLSVMTHFLVKKIINSESLTLGEAYDYVKVEVPKYMEEHFPGRKQTPQLCPQDGSDVRLR